MLPYTVFNGISAAALIKLFTPQMQYLLEDGVYLEVGRDEITSPSDLRSTDFYLCLSLTRSRAWKNVSSGNHGQVDFHDGQVTFEAYLTRVTSGKIL